MDPNSQQVDHLASIPVGLVTSGMANKTKVCSWLAGTDRIGMFTFHVTAPSNQFIGWPI